MTMGTVAVRDGSLHLNSIVLHIGFSAERRNRMSITSKNPWEDLQNGAYDFPTRNRGFLHNLFVTAVRMENEKQITMHIPDGVTYRDAIARYRLRGIRVKCVRGEHWNYKYTAVIRPSVLLGSMRRFRKQNRAG